MKVRGIIQARMLSTRLRGKSLISVAGKPLLGRVLDRVTAMNFLTDIVVATTDHPSDEPIEALVTSRGQRCFRGELEDVLARFVGASSDMDDGDIVVRFTADNPLYDPQRSKLAYEKHIDGSWDYTHIDGLSHMVPEYVRVGALRKVDARVSEDRDREHVTLYMRKHLDEFRIQMLPMDFADLRPDLDHLLTINDQIQVERFERMLETLEKGEKMVSLDDCYLWADKERMELLGALPFEPGQKRIKLAGHEVGDGCPCFVVAEIGQNHNGQMNNAKRLIELAARCGADAVKFQKRDVRWDLTAEAYNRPYDNPNSFGPTYGEHREFLEFSAQQHLELRDYVLGRGLVYFCTPCDPPSVEQLESIGTSFYKIASRDITNIPLLRCVAETGKPVIVSTGMADMREIREALDALGDGPAGIILMQCVSQYPAEVTNVNLRAMETMRKEFDVLVGLSDHTPGIITAVAAAVLGACVVEKHVTLARAMIGTDHAAALEEEGLRRVVRYIRICARSMGDGKKRFNPVAAEAKEKLARSLTSRVPIPAGSTLTEEMLILKSPGTGLLWRERNRIVGRKASRDILIDTTLSEKDFA